jgi:hypothetical protein
MRVTGIAAIRRVTTAGDAVVGTVTGTAGTGSDTSTIAAAEAAGGSRPVSWAGQVCEA